MTQYRTHLTRWMTAMLLAWGTLTPTVDAATEHTWAENSVLAKGIWVKIALSRDCDGIYQISYSDLRKWGFSDPSQVGVYGFGGHKLSENLADGHIDDLPEVATLHDADKERILFYGRGLVSWSYTASNGFVQQQHPYANMEHGTYACYFLHQKEDEAPLSLEEQASDDATSATLTLTEYDEYWLHETAEANLGNAGQEWYGESFINQTVQSFSMPEETALKGHSFLPGTTRITVAFATKASATSTLQIALNDSVLGSLSIGSTSEYGSENSYDATLTKVSTLSSPTVKLTYKAGSSSPSAARLNYIRLQGKCALQASSQEPYMLFRNAKAISRRVAYKLSGLNSQMQVWDVTSPNDIRHQQLLGDTLFVPSTTGLREYAVVNLQSTAYPTVYSYGALSRTQDLHGCDSINLVIVAPTGLFQQADSLAHYRARYDQLSCAVVSPDAIYNEFSSGVPDATAIRLFLKRLYDRETARVKSDDERQLRYLLLFGDGSYDNYSACASKYMLPCYENTQSLTETGSYVTDDYFGMLDDEVSSLAYGTLDVGVGRIPASSSEEADEMLAKITGYDQKRYGSWRNRICFLADDEKIENGTLKDPENEHVSHCDEMASILEQQGHKELAIQKIYLPAYQQTSTTSGTDYADARKDLYNALQEGVLMLDYAGHGAANNICHEQLITVNTASQLRMSHLPLWIMASCNVARWDDDDASLCEALVLNPNGGAAAVLGAAREVYMTNNRNLNRQLMTHLCDRLPDGSPYALGDVIKAAKCNMTGDANKLSYNLLGDPSMTLALPSRRVVVDSIHGEFKTLSTVTIYGHVNQSDGEEMDTDFSGLLYSTIYDAVDTLTCDQGLWNGENAFSFTARKRRLFSGRSIVQKGQFEFTFMMPQDISYNEGNGLMNFYAWNGGLCEASGYYEDFAIERDATADTEADTTPPTIIACFMDSPDFADGDRVSTTPFFYAEVADASGINATGNSIGHDITLTLKCLSNPIISTQQYVLNNQFTTFTGSSSHGNVKYSLTDLQEGTYQATFRVWDVYNNVSSRTFTFEVSNESLPEIASLQAYPSPATQGSTVTFQVLHNRPESADQLRLQIYTQTGVKVLDKEVSTSSCEVVYLEQNATSVLQTSSYMNADETSQLLGRTTMTWTADVAPGIYLYRVYLSAGSEETASESQKLIITAH
ncbi:MAG: type IX secretion system sortase PorU [Bacteroidales bacterium]|nr:type IX secretion system sortase PorU [Bacteroidales bacterium]